MTMYPIGQNRGFKEAAARFMLTLAWRAFAATQCRALPSDIEGGLIAIFNAYDKENTA